MVSNVVADLFEKGIMTIKGSKFQRKEYEPFREIIKLLPYK